MYSTALDKDKVSPSGERRVKRIVRRAVPFDTNVYVSAASHVVRAYAQVADKGK